jgi:predicted ATPase/HPt (histidine-containing phosphotransfer) domain-containing protein
LELNPGSRSVVNPSVRIPGYVFDHRLYEGSATVVYAGLREADRAPVVGKLVTGGMRDLREEFSFIERVAGPGIVEALGLFDSSDGPVLVMRRFGSENLGQALARGPLSTARTLHVARQLAEALAHLHGKRTLHRDVKPANILYDRNDDTVVLADFGIAAELPAGARALAVRDLIGTPSHVAPEQTGRTSDGCDFRSDLYSLGITLYELLTGKLPFPSTDLLELVSAQLSQLPPRPTLHNPAVPELLGAIVMKLCAKSPAERYQSARGLLADLTRCQQTLAPDGTIASFELGRSDLRRPHTPERLHGRDVELGMMSDYFARAKQGAPTMVLVTGPQGCGREALVQSFLRAQPGAPAAVGGWKSADDRPLAGISEALSSLARGLLLLEDERLATVRKNVLEHVGSLGQVVLDIAPALADVFGPQPEPPALGPTQSRARMRYVFRRFITGLGAEQGCVLALSRVEHADDASRSLLEALLEEGDSRVLVVLSAEDKSAFGALAQHASTASIELGPLSPAAVTGWVAEALDMTVPQVAELSAALHEKSGGNSSLVASLLEHWVEQGVIERRDGAFTWSIAAVRAAKAPPSLAALVSQRVAGLPAAQREVLASLAAADEGCTLDAVTAMVEAERDTVLRLVNGLEREGLVMAVNGGFAVALPAIVSAAVAAVPAEHLQQLRARLALHSLRTALPAEFEQDSFRVAKLLHAGCPALTGEERARAAQIYARAGVQVTRALAYGQAATFFEAGEALLDQQTAQAQRELAFELAIGRGRSLMMLGQNDRAEEVLKALCGRELTPQELGIAYPARIDNRSVVSDRAGAIEIGIEALGRLGIKVPAEPSNFKPLPALFSNELKLSKLSAQDYLDRPVCSDEKAFAIIRVLSTMTTPAFLSRRTNLYLLVSELALATSLRYGHTNYLTGFLCTHSSVLLGGMKKYDKARRSYEACRTLELERPSGGQAARMLLPLYYFLHPWFSSWKESADGLALGVQRSIESGDPLFAALCASGCIMMHAMSGTPLDRLAAMFDTYAPQLKADRALWATLSNGHNIAAKVSRGEPIVQADLDRITQVPLQAAGLRNNPMVNFGLALAVIGHEAQVRSWLDEIRASFAKVNFSQPQIANLWLLDGLFAAKDARNGQPRRLRMTTRMIDTFSKLQKKTKTTNHEAAIALLEAEVARAKGEVYRASGLYGRAASEARARDLIHLVAYAMEQRAEMLAQAGQADEAALFYRESVIAYRRWGHVTKVQELENALPELRAMQLSRGDAAPQSGTQHTVSESVHRSVHKSVHQAASATRGTPGNKPGRTLANLSRTINESLDLSTVLKISQEISTQLHGSGVVRTVLTGIAQNAGAERVLFILRDQNGKETVYGELHNGHYQGVNVALESYAEVPRSLLKLLRRTGKPVVIADATNDPAHASDPFVVASRCRSIAGIPILKKGELSGFVVLENRLAPGAFTLQLIGLTQALVSQAAISLDNASLYEDMESRVRERTAALHARNNEMRLVLDNVVQGLAIIDLSGRLSPESSAVLREWFPGGLPDEIGGFFAHDPNASFVFQSGWEQLLDGFLPAELCIDQLPKRLTLREQTFALSWEPIEDDAGAMTRMLFVMSDITEALRAQEAEAEQRQQMVLFQRLSSDRTGVLEFMKEAASIVRDIESAVHGGEVEKRLVHTLKGNAGFFGLNGLMTLCHDLESKLIEDQRTLTPEERALVSQSWAAIHTRVKPFLNVGADALSVRKVDYDSVLRALVREASPVANDVEMWKLEPLESRFQRIAEQAEKLAERLDKGPVQVQMEHGGVRIESGPWAPFWSAFVHALRNALDHGIEPSWEREALGKGIGTIQLRAHFAGPDFVFELSDDGRGIAWDRVRDRARAHGLPSETHQELVAALFSDGISTKEVVDETSGRGVGMGALRDACEAMQAKIEVDSVAGQGTTWRFVFPSHVARQPRERRPSLSASVYPPSDAQQRLVRGVS